jgi:hypothetical protein
MQKIKCHRLPKGPLLRLVRVIKEVESSNKLADGFKAKFRCFLRQIRRDLLRRSRGIYAP